MKTRLQNLLLILGLVVGFVLVLTGRVAGQNFTTLHTFADYDDFGDGNIDGIEPVGLMSSAHTLYGMAYKGGASNVGTVFKMNNDGSGFAVLYSFTSSADAPINNGNFPVGELVLSGNTLFGATQSGGTNNNGTVFKINTDGSGLTVLHKFSYLKADAVGANNDGFQPQAGLILSGDILYGTASYGGVEGVGTVFAVNTNGTGFRALHSFSAVDVNGYNKDGAVPYASLVLFSNTLYGTASEGGPNGNGTVFSVTTNGTSFKTLHSFTAVTPNTYYGSNSDGAFPYAGLVLAGNTLYGTASGGGTNGNGTVFSITTNGTGFTVLHSFSVTDVNGNNSDGIEPNAGLFLSGSTLYGTAYEGGTAGSGTIFAVSTNGTGFTTLHSFNYDSDGGDPLTGLVLSDNTLYGAARDGGTNDHGAVFSISVAPKLIILPSGPNLIFSWPTNVNGFTLKSATNLGSSAVWTSVSSSPVIVDSNNVVTNTSSDLQKFYRLSQ